VRPEVIANILGGTVEEEEPFTVSGVEAEVCLEIARRQQFGLAKYGVTVEDNPLSLIEWVVHAKQEAMDLAVYLTKIERVLRNLGDDNR